MNSPIKSPLIPTISQVSRGFGIIDSDSQDQHSDRSTFTETRFEGDFLKKSDRAEAMNSPIKSPLIPTISQVSRGFGIIDSDSQDQHSDNKPVDRYGFYTSTSDSTSNVEQSAAQKRAEQARETEWISLMANWDVNSKSKSSRIKKLCREGIPESIRPHAWQKICNSKSRMETGVYEQLIESPDRPKIFDVIERDVNRCFPNHEMFASSSSTGQANLRAVLRAYALFNPQLGYCQGMGMLVGVLLMRMSPQDTFWMLVVILEKYIPDYHSVTLYQLRVDAAAFEICLKRFSRPLAKHMSDLLPLTYMTSWFLTLFTMALPWNTVLRVWDMFLFDEYIITQCPTASDILAYLLVAPKSIDDEEAFVADCLKIRLGHNDLDLMRKQVKKTRGSLDSKLNKQESDAQA